MEDTQTVLSFASISGKKVEVDFNGGTTTGDGGVLLLSYTDLIRQRVLQIACGYEDANDSDDLRSDPGMKAACDRLPITGDDLASQPTISRLENQVSRTALYRVGRAFLDTFIDSYDKPRRRSSWTSMTRMMSPMVHSNCRCSTPTMTSIATCRSISTKGSRAS